MPLRSGSSPQAFKANVRTLMGEIGKSPHVQSREQALAIAYAKQRQGRQGGGSVCAPIASTGYGAQNTVFSQPGMRAMEYGPQLPELQNAMETNPQLFEPSANVQQQAAAIQALVPPVTQTNRARGGDVGYQVGGLVDHDFDPELPPARDEVQMIPVMQHQIEHPFMTTLRQLAEGQRRLNAMSPVERERLRRYWLGGLAYWVGGVVR